MKSTEFIAESTFRIGQDVDMLYNMFFKKVVQDIHNDTWDDRAVDLDADRDRLNTSILNSKQAKQAHLKNPVMIINSQNNSYSPLRHFVSVSLSEPALNVIRSKGSLKNALQFLERNFPTQVRQFKADITPSRIKGSIYHELSHWLDDTFHNKHITKAVAFAQERGDSKSLTQGEATTDLTKYEVNAQIHAIKQLKRNNSKIWNNITFDQMIDMSTALQVVERDLSTTDNQRWRKMILKRMAREKLLGARMTKE